MGATVAATAVVTADHGPGQACASALQLLANLQHILFAAQLHIVIRIWLRGIVRASDSERAHLGIVRASARSDFIFCVLRRGVCVLRLPYSREHK
jgi:hypothetical protein